MIAIAKRYQSTVKTRPSVPCTGLEACKIPLAPARNCAKPSLAGEVALHRRCNAGGGSLHTNGLTRGNTPTPALPRIRLRQKAGFGGRESGRGSATCLAAAARVPIP